MLLLVGAGAAAAPIAPGDKPVETLTRTGKWVANYDRDSCTVVAPMGEGPGAAAVKFTRYEPGDNFDMWIVGSRFAERAPRVGGTVDFGLSPAPFEAYAFAGNTGKHPVLIFDSMRIDGWHASRLNEVGPVISRAQEGQVTGLTLALRGKAPLRFEFGPLTEPMVAMRRCMEQLVRRWGYDPVQQAAAQRPASPIKEPRTWLKFEDYPFKAMMRGHNGIVQFRLDVDAEGAVAGCVVLARTNPDDFGDITCRAITKRAKFHPALDVRGEPMRAFWVGSVRWVS